MVYERDDVEDWRVVVLARPGGFDEYAVYEDGVELVASVDIDA